MAQKFRKGFIRLMSILMVGVYGLPLDVKADCTYEKTLKTEDLNLGIMLTWTTSSESDNSQFIVEKSIDGATFENIGTVNGAGSSNLLKDYNFFDLAASKGISFYRLKQVDFDGTFSYSAVAKQGKTTTNQLLVMGMSSETTAKNFEVTLETLAEGELSCALKDAQGNIVQQNNQMLVYGLNNINIDLTDQKVGIYRLVMTMGDEEETLVIRKVADEMASKPVMASSRKSTGKN